MKVADLVKAAASKASPFTPRQTAAVREILAANDKQPNVRKRVSAETARQYLADQLGYTKALVTFRVHVRQAFGRGWEK